MKEKKEQIAELLNLSSEDLLKKIGQSYLMETNFSFDEDDFSEDERLEEGESWFNRNLEKIRNTVCKNELIKSTMTSQSTDNVVNLIATIGDALNPYFSKMPIFTLSTFIYKIGIHKFCNYE